MCSVAENTKANITSADDDDDLKGTGIYYILCNIM